MLSRNTGPANLGRMTAATILVLAGGQACGLFDDGTCPLPNPPGIVIDLLDARSGSFVPHSANPAGFVIEDGMREPMRLRPPEFGEAAQLSGGWGPPGARSEVFVYDVEITADGYATWHASGIRVEVDNCSIAQTVELTARLTPLNRTE